MWYNRAPFREFKEQHFGYRGVDWYLRQYPNTNSSSDHVICKIILASYRGFPAKSYPLFSSHFLALQPNVSRVKDLAFDDYCNNLPGLDRIYAAIHPKSDKNGADNSATSLQHNTRPNKRVKLEKQIKSQSEPNS